MIKLCLQVIVRLTPHESFVPYQLAYLQFVQAFTTRDALASVKAQTHLQFGPISV